MIKARLEAFLPPGMRLSVAMDSWDARAVWDLLVRRGILPHIRDRDPYTSASIGWGELAAGGIFFVTKMTKTKYGFYCQISIYPAGDLSSAPLNGFIIRWLEKNLFRGKAKGLQNPHNFKYCFSGEDKILCVLESCVFENIART